MTNNFKAYLNENLAIQRFLIYKLIYGSHLFAGLHIVCDRKM